MGNTPDCWSQTGRRTSRTPWLRMWSIPGKHKPAQEGVLNITFRPLLPASGALVCNSHFQTERDLANLDASLDEHGTQTYSKHWLQMSESAPQFSCSQFSKVWISPTSREEHLVLCPESEDPVLHVPHNSEQFQGQSSHVWGHWWADTSSPWSQHDIHNHTLSTALVPPGSFHSPRGQKPDSSHPSLKQLLLIVLPGNTRGFPACKVLHLRWLQLRWESVSILSWLLLLGCVFHMTLAHPRSYPFSVVENFTENRKLRQGATIISVNSPCQIYPTADPQYVHLTVLDIWALYISCLTRVLKYIWFQI